MFNLDECVLYIATNSVKEITEVFNEKLISMGVSRVQWIALYYLGIEQGISQADLGARMNIKGSTTARLIDRMEREGYVKREKDSLDRRVTRLNLTKKGYKYREELMPACVNFTQQISKGINEEDIQIFMDVLAKMTKNLKKL